MTHAFKPQPMLPILALVLLLVGLYQALPHLAFAWEMGTVLCLTEGGLGFAAVWASNLSHCWGCPVALLGTAMLLCHGIWWINSDRRAQIINSARVA